MNELTIINTSMFNDDTYDVYSDGNRIYMTRKQIGQALGYDDPQLAIDKIHLRHKDRLDNLSVTTKLVGTDGKMYNTYLYNQRGIMEICRWSRQPLADKFMDWVWDIIEAYYSGSPFPHPTTPSFASMTQEQIEAIIDDKLAQFKERYLSLSDSGSNSYNVTSIQPAIQEPMDIIRNSIEPLAKSLNDNSKGYTCTYRKVYAAMNVSWSHRLSRYKNKHNNKNKPSKLRLIASDPKLLKLFVNTIDELQKNSY